MIFTSYFANNRKIDDICSISRYSPKWLTDITEHKQLAPSAELLSNYKKNKNQSEYIKQYYEETSDVDWVSLAKQLDNKTICCYEKHTDFCHRHLVSKKFRENGVFVVEKLDTYNIAVIGSRGYIDKEFIYSEMDALILLLGDSQIVIVSGGARGPDRISEGYAKSRGYEINVFKADWDKLGKRAGFVRNHDIINAADIVVAFWDGDSTGTKHSLGLTTKALKPLLLYTGETLSMY